MYVSFSIPVLVAAMAVSTAAVDITLYQDSLSCAGNGLTCGNIAVADCCENGQDFFSVLFSGLDTAGVPDFGVTFQQANGQNCGTSCTSGTGGGLCLEPGTCPAIQGAAWFRANTKMVKRVDPGSQKNCTKPKLAVFKGGRSFRINYDVPADVTSTLLELIKGDADVTAVPADILHYEVTD